MASADTRVLFIAGFGPIDRDLPASRALYGESLGIAFKEDAGGYLYTGSLSGAKHFAVWPLCQAAQSCFGRESWPANVPIPQAWLEFEAENVEVQRKSAEIGSQLDILRIESKNKRPPSRGGFSLCKGRPKGMQPGPSKLALAPIHCGI